MVEDDKRFAPATEKAKVEMTYEAGGYTTRPRGRVLSECHGLESEGKRGYMENPSLWWTTQTPFDVGGS